MWFWCFIEHGVVLFLQRVGAIPGNGHGIQGQKYVIVYQKSDDGPGAALHVAKTKSIRKWELNTSLA